MKPLLPGILFIAGTLLSVGLPAAQPSLEEGALPPRARALLATSLGFTDRFYDDRIGILWSPIAEDNVPGKPRMHYTRDSAFYAVGLLIRDRAGDRDRALRIVRAILPQQAVAPGKPWDGNFYAYLEEPPKRDVSLGGNLRQFIGCAFAMAIETNGAKIPAALQAEMQDSIVRGVAGELAQRRLTASYSNIALLEAWLQSYAGVHSHRPEWVRGGEEFARAVDEGFRAHGSFSEFNSPTYYGVDLWGLSLWRAFPPTPLFQRLGSALEANLWHTIADFYNPSLKNMCGPFDRAYGMDMNVYVTGTGMWMALALDPAAVPLPPSSANAQHPHDYDLGSLLVAAGIRIPSEVVPALEHFEGEHLISRPLPDHRLATAWLSENLMLGAEATSGMRMAGIPVGATEEHSHNAMATAHWRTPGGGIGWIELFRSPRCDAHAAKNQLSIEGAGEYVFRIGAPEARLADLGCDTWKLPGLDVRVETDANGWSTAKGPQCLEVHYNEATRFVFRTAWHP